ncbi:MAG: bifunctional tetrahydrofolate synthase/dihydrofolate synthase [Methylococcaceae bacterium]|nr:MAG: bifunctional tetrahydrofolate synthase/dihydrofolate synthase [Methylococcaceae bacterium]
MRFSTLADWLAWQETLHPKPIDLGLQRVRRVFDALGGGELPYTITVGGTNGKGSSVALLVAILRAAGYRVGAYTSPHLLRYNERIQIDGRPVDDQALCDAFARVDAARGDTSLSYFEFGTLTALDIFRRGAVDVQVLEVGLGGRLDAVNIVDADAALLASIDIDHQEWLGDTCAAIALEKAGIYRQGRPAVLGDAQAPQSLLDYALEQGIPLDCQCRDFGFTVGDAGWSWHSGQLVMQNLPFPALAGRHQLFNAAAVLQLLRRIGERLPVPETAIRQGLSTVTLAGRFQLLPGTPPVLVDVAHNPQAVRVLAGYLREAFAGRRVLAVFAIMRDKDVAGVVNGITDLVAAWYLAPLALPRAAAVPALQTQIAASSQAPIHTGFADVAQAFQAARREAGAGDLIVVFGSFFLVAEFLAQTLSGKR